MLVMIKDLNVKGHICCEFGDRSLQQSLRKVNHFVIMPRQPSNEAFEAPRNFDR